MKPEYYIYSWPAGAFRCDGLSKSLKGYSCRDTAERIASFRFEGMNDRIRYCVALTDDEAFVEMRRQNMPNMYYDTDDAKRRHKCRRLFRVRYGMFGDYPCDSCITNYYNADGNVYRADNFYMKHPYTTKEFIEYMLAQFPYGWGYIMLHEHGEKLVDDAVKCEHVNGYLKTSLPEKYTNREVYTAEAYVTIPRMDIDIYTY